MNGLDQRVLDGIRVMAAVVDSRSFGRASEALDMSQSGVSRAIARLEKQLGLRLFDRTTRSVRMTDEGRSFYEQVMPLVASLEEITASASGSSKVLKGRLRVNIDPFFSRLVPFDSAIRGTPRLWQEGSWRRGSSPRQRRPTFSDTVGPKTPRTWSQASIAAFNFEIQRLAGRFRGSSISGARRSCLARAAS